MSNEDRGILFTLIFNILTISNLQDTLRRFLIAWQIKKYGQTHLITWKINLVRLEIGKGCIGRFLPGLKDLQPGHVT